MHFQFLFVANIFLWSFVVCSTNIQTIQDVEGYYWRDYLGEIPSDAVPGGKDKQGRITYIGQALHMYPPNGKLIPGIINSDAKSMSYAWNDSEYVVNINIKILCSQHPENFVWVEADIARLQSSPQINLVLGGYDTSYPLYIGRKHLSEEIALGKVTIPSPYNAFGYTADGNAHWSQDQFEILTYKEPKQVKLYVIVNN